MRLLTNQSDLSRDPDTANWLFESAVLDHNDPLTILLQREQEIDEDFEYYLPRSSS